MREDVIRIVRNAIENRTQFYTREQEIQIHIAKELEGSGLFDYVYLEYHIPSQSIENYPWLDANNIYIDIVVKRNGRFLPIEIKFKTKAQQILTNVFGTDLPIVLGQHGAQNIGCYDFWKDVKRLEIFENQFENVDQGVMLFVSNDESYMQYPRNEYVGYFQFSIHQDKSVVPGELLSWNGDLNVAIGRPPISISRGLVINWVELNLHQHSYILV